MTVLLPVFNKPAIDIYRVRCRRRCKFYLNSYRWHIFIFIFFFSFLPYTIYHSHHMAVSVYAHRGGGHGWVPKIGIFRFTIVVMLRNLGTTNGCKRVGHTDTYFSLTRISKMEKTGLAGEGGQKKKKKNQDRFCVYRTTYNNIILKNTRRVQSKNNNNYNNRESINAVGRRFVTRERNNDDDRLRIINRDGDNNIDSKNVKADENASTAPS